MLVLYATQPGWAAHSSSHPLPPSIELSKTLTAHEASIAATELCSGDSLLTFRDRLTMHQSTSIAILFRRPAVTILLGLVFLHKNNIVHSDLKPANILLSCFDLAKLADL